MGKKMRLRDALCMAVLGLTLAGGLLYRRHKQFLNASLAAAVEHADAPTVRSLLARGADPNGRDTDGKQVLTHLSAGSGKGHSRLPTQEQIETARLLVKAGVEPTTSFSTQLATEGPLQKIEQSHLQTFAALGDIEMMRTMLARARNHSPLSIDQGALLLGVADDAHLPMLAFLLDAGLNPNAVSGSGDYPLNGAAGSGDVAAVGLLLKHGANPNNDVANLVGTTPLIGAVGKQKPQHREIMKMLTASGASVSQEDHNGATALDVASLNGNVNAIAFLLAHGADINRQRATDGFTPLASAIGTGKRQAVELLLARGADPKVRVWVRRAVPGSSHVGSMGGPTLRNAPRTGTPLFLREYAVECKHPELAPLLQQAAAGKPSTLSK